MFYCEYMVWDKKAERDAYYDRIPMTSLFPGSLIICGEPAEKYKINKKDNKGIQEVCLCPEHYEFVKDSNDYSEIRRVEKYKEEEKKSLYGAKLL